LPDPNVSYDEKTEPRVVVERRGRVRTMATKPVSHQRPVPRAPTRRRRTPKVRFQRGPKQHHQSWGEFLAAVRSDPKAALEGDFRAVLAGLVIIFLGSVLVGGDAYWTVWSSSPGPPTPILGIIVFFIGGVIVLAGLVLAVLCLIVNVLARMSRRTKP